MLIYTNYLHEVHGDVYSSVHIYVCEGICMYVYIHSHIYTASIYVYIDECILYRMSVYVELFTVQGEQPWPMQSLHEPKCMQ